MFIKRFLRRNRLIITKIAKYQAIIFAISVVIGLLRGDTRPSSIGGIMAMVGLSLVAMSVFGILGAWEATRNFQYQYASSAGPESIHERVQSERRDMRAAFGFVGSSTTVGIWSAIIGGALFFFL